MAPLSAQLVPALHPLLRTSRFRGRRRSTHVFQRARAVKQNRELCPGPVQASRGSVTLPCASPAVLRNVNRIPFPRKHALLFFSTADIVTGFPCALGAAHPPQSDLTAEPFLASVFKAPT